METARLRLRAYQEGDLEHLVELIGNWEVARWLGRTPHPYSRADGREWIDLVQRNHQSGRPTRFAIAVRATDQLVGGIGFVGPAEPAGSAEIGFWVGQPFWCLGYAREAIAAILDYGFTRLLVTAITAVTDPRNVASQRALMASGFRATGTIKLDKLTRESRSDHALQFSTSRAFSDG